MSTPRQARAGVDVFEVSFSNLGVVVVLAIDALRCLFTRRPIWIREAAIQSVFIVRTVMRPVMAVNGIFALSIIGLALGVPSSSSGPATATRRSSAWA